tara:strand:+ start:454 stop:939 length:486 start_codon:yes stop_codon:yes gene_type:complete
METGTYQDHKNWNKYRVNKFNFTLFDPFLYGTFGCGANALACVTGKNPKNFLQKSGHYSDEFMVKQLRKNNINVLKLTKSNLTNDKKASIKIDDRHVLLISQLFSKGEASWVIHHAGMFIHNFETDKCSYWHLLNFPIVSAYVLFKKKWRDEKPRIRLTHI